MYFSRIKINLQNSNLSRWVELMKGDIYTVHQTLWRLFPNQEKRSFLFYQESQPDHKISSSFKNEMPIFYVISEIVPKPYSDLFIIDTKTYTPLLNPGQHFYFKLRANPVIRVRKPDYKNPFTHDVLMHAKQKLKGEIDKIWPEMEKAALNWLLGRSNKCGFAINADQIRIQDYQCHRLYKKKQDRCIRFSSVDYSGILTVNNAEFFKESLFKGIGKAKSFGCGLLLIRPCMN